MRGKARVQSGLRRRRVSFKTYVEKEGSGGRRARVRESINGKREKRRRYNDGNRKNNIIFI